MHIILEDPGGAVARSHLEGSMNILLGTLLGLILGSIMIVTLILPALRERERKGSQSIEQEETGSETKGADGRALALNREEIWNRGCRGEALSDAEQDEFNYLARARFYTFQMGISHASDDQGKRELLIKGLAVELTNSPGLERQWYRSDMSEEPSGQAVNALLSELRQ